MNTSQEDLDLIEQYINGELSDEEAIATEARLRKDDRFKNLYRDYVKSRKSINDAVKERLKKKVIQELNEKKQRKIIWLKPLSIAAGFLIIIAGSMWVFNQDGSTPEQLFSEYYNSPPTPNLRSQDPEPKIQEAFIAYQNQNYISADTLLARLLETNNINRKEELLLLFAATLIELNRVDDAVIQLKLISEESALYQDAQWYILLAYLRIGNKEEAKKAIDDILSIEKHFKTDEAKRIFKSLD